MAIGAGARVAAPQVCYMAVGAQLRPISGSEQSPYGDGDIPALSDWTGTFDCFFDRCVDVICQR